MNDRSEIVILRDFSFLIMGSRAGWQLAKLCNVRKAPFQGPYRQGGRPGPAFFCFVVHEPAVTWNKFDGVYSF